MTVIDGINVAIYECDSCGSNKMWIFHGEGGEGYKISCADCKKEQRELITELNIPYLWKHKESTQPSGNKEVNNG